MASNLDLLEGMHDSCVYAIGPQESHHPIKIGVSTSVLKRYRALVSASPLPLIVFGVLRCQRFYETRIHAALDAHRVHGEWFSRSPETLELVAILAGHEIEALDTWLRDRK